MGEGEPNKMGDCDTWPDDTQMVDTNDDGKLDWVRGDRTDPTVRVAVWLFKGQLGKISKLHISFS